MQCSRCNTENDAFRRFCHQCGGPLGLICDRCGHVNGYKDAFCGMCGTILRLSNVEGAAQGTMGGVPKGENAHQYTPEDIKELLSLRNAILKDEDQAAGMKQEDIDNLFG